ncbi:hypothetical protein [Streptomyces umbrinus]|uniref:hypothetical protein n=1 Tax=Streptomyces umbrinus TaxID=67370 RepID=UPI0033C2BC39
MERTDGNRWLISAFHNMIPAPRSAPAPKETAVEESTAPETAARPKLRHLAIVARDPERLADLYSSVFAVELFHRDPDGSCFLPTATSPLP